MQAKAKIKQFIFYSIISSYSIPFNSVQFKVSKENKFCRGISSDFIKFFNKKKAEKEENLTLSISHLPYCHVLYCQKSHLQSPYCHVLSPTTTTYCDSNSWYRWKSNVQYPVIPASRIIFLSFSLSLTASFFQSFNFHRFFLRLLEKFGMRKVEKRN